MSSILDQVATDKSKILGLLATWGMNGTKAGGGPITDDEVTSRNAEIHRFFEWLAVHSDSLSVPKIRTLIKVLKFTYDDVYANRHKYFSHDVRLKAQTLVTIWEVARLNGEDTDEFGKDVAARGSSSQAAAPTVSSQQQAPSPHTSARRSARQQVHSIRIPAATHIFFGHNAPLDGIALRNNIPVLNPARSFLKGNFRGFGHRGHQPGEWFVNQLHALFNGVHGQKQGGISGDSNQGAYSVILTHLYENLDRDLGDTIFYSASLAHQNVNPAHIGNEGPGTMILRASLATGNPVRVLRSASGSNFAPYKGVRYDGLYTVVSVNQATNRRGGLYNQFKLVRRQAGQPSLAQCRQRVSMATQDRLTEGYKAGY